MCSAHFSLYDRGVTFFSSLMPAAYEDKNNLVVSVKLQLVSGSILVNSFYGFVRNPCFDFCLTSHKNIVLLISVLY